jgi:hypothetical protein
MDAHSSRRPGQTAVIPAPRRVFLLKVPVDGRCGEARFHYGHAERVHKRDGRLWAENIQLPMLDWRQGTLQWSRQRLTDRFLRGFAYRVPTPVWFAPEEESCAPPRADENATAVAAWNVLLETSAWGKFCRHPEVRVALAQDVLAAEIESFLRAPDLLAHEDRLYADWENERPEAAGHAREQGEFPGEDWEKAGDFAPLRKRLRLAALRRIDAAAVGRETFAPCPAFLGEPYLAFDLGRGFRFKAGIAVSCRYRPTPDSETLARTWRSDPALVRAVERRLFPVASPEAIDAPEAFASAAAEWTATALLRDFESRSPLPLFPVETVYPGDFVPENYGRRIPPEALAAAGTNALAAAAAGISIYIAEPFRIHAEARLPTAKSANLAGLAAAKWGRPVAYDVLHEVVRQ